MVDFTSDKFVINKIKKIFWIDKEKQPIDTKMLFKKFDDNECGIFHGQPSNTYEIKSLFAGFIFFHVKDDTVCFTDNLRKFDDNGIKLRIKDSSKFSMFETGFVLPPYTIYADTYRLCPRTMVKITETVKSKMIEISNHFNKKVPMLSCSYDNAVEKLRLMIKEGLLKDYNKHKPDKIVFTISGGVDSSILLKLGVETLPKDRIIALTSKSPGQDVEFERCKALCENFGIKLEVYEPQKELIGKYSKAYVERYLEPIFDLVAPVENMMMEKVLQGNKKIMVVEGQGADSLFMGLPHNIAISLKKKYEDFSYIFKVMSFLLNGVSFDRNSNFGRKIYRIKKLLNVISTEEIVEAFGVSLSLEKIFHAENEDYISYFEKIMKPIINNFDSINRAICYFFMYRLLPVREIQKYRQLVDYGVKFSFPFISEEVVDFAESLPEEYMFSGSQRKKIIFDLAKRTLPEIDFGNKTTPFFVDTPVELNQLEDELKIIYKKYVNKRSDREIFVKSLLQFNDFIKVIDRK